MKTGTRNPVGVLWGASLAFNQLRLAALLISLCALSQRATTAGEVAAWVANSLGRASVPAGLSNVITIAAAGASRYAVWVGTTPGSYNLYAGVVTGLSDVATTLSRIVAGLPTNGGNVYVTLWAWVNNTWRQVYAYTYTAPTAAGSEKAKILSPANGTTNTSASVTFTWDGGVGASVHALWIGSTPNSYDLYAGVEYGLARTLTLPVDGRTLYVTLWSWMNGSWQSNAYSYTAYSAPIAQMVSPAPGITVTGDRVTFEWSHAPGAIWYALWVGSNPNTYDLYAGLETGQSRMVKVPTDGRALHVTLWSFVNGAWQSDAYSYTAYTASASEKALLSSPASGTILTSDRATFEWSSGVGATWYALWVGSSPSSYDLYAAVEPGLSKTVKVPTDGRALHVTLWSWINGAWQSDARSYTAYTASAPEKATMQTPVPGSTLTGAATKFSWSSGVGATWTALWVGSCLSAYDLYAGLEPGLSRILTLPTNGQTLYVTLWSWINGAWQSNAYSYTASGP